MKKFEEFITKQWSKIVIILLLTIFVNTCSNPTKVTNKRIDQLTHKIDSLSGEIVLLKKESVTSIDLQIEGLKTEKRMIQSTDRKILDVNRQAEIDREIKKLESK